MRAIATRGNEVFAGGDFVKAGSLEVNHIARWDGAQWNTIGSGPGLISSVSAIAVKPDGSDVYVGGEFYSVPGLSSGGPIVRWDGSVWNSMGRFSGRVYTILVSGSDVYAGGSIVDYDIYATCILRWDGSKWNDVGLFGGMNAYCGYEYPRSLAMSSDGKLYAAGDFSVAVAIDGLERTNYACGFAVYDGANWGKVGDDYFTNRQSGDYSPGCPSIRANAVAFQGNYINVGGSFSDPRDNSYIDKFARWLDGTWNTLGANLGKWSNVNSIVAGSGYLYIAGNFVNAGGNPAADYIARYDGAGWHGLPDHPVVPVPTATPIGGGGNGGISGGDTSRPSLKILTTRGSSGSSALIKYRVGDNSGRTADKIRIFKRTRTCASYTKRYSRIPSNGIRKVTLSTRRCKRGKNGICITVTDPSFHATMKCSSIRLW